MVDIYNATMLSEHKGKLWTFHAKDRGHQKQLASLVSCKKILHLKVGVPVIVTRNLKDMQIYNGTRGVVTALDELEGEPIVRISDSERNRNSNTTPVDFNIIQKGQTHTRRQLPLKLAWAMTVHRSQGQTLNKVHIDCLQMFSPCHLSVALSRACSTELITLSNLDLSSLVSAPSQLLQFITTGEPPVQVRL